jgi:hypothetical protein
MPWSEEQKEAQRQRMLEFYRNNEHYMTGRTQDPQWVENARRARWGGERVTEVRIPDTQVEDGHATNEQPLADLTNAELRGIAYTKGVTLPKKATKAMLLEALANAGMTKWGDTIG